jgi:hypothetical protein
MKFPGDFSVIVSVIVRSWMFVIVLRHIPSTILLLLRKQYHHMREYSKRAVRLGRAPVGAENKNPAQDVLIKANRIVFARVSAMTRIKLVAEW